MEEKPLNMFEQSTKPGERITDKPELPPQGFAMHMVADTESIEGEAHLKLGKARGFEIYSDEPAHIGDELPRNGHRLLTAHPGGAVRVHDQVEGEESQVPRGIRLPAQRVGTQGYREDHVEECYNRP